MWLTDADGVRRLDPSGVVKGWAVDRAVAPLLALPGTDVCLSAGGDMVCHVADPDGEPWVVGVEDPHDPTPTGGARPAACVAPSRPPGRRTAVGTWSTRGRACPRPALASVTVVGASLTSVDIDATTALALGVDGPGWLRSRLRTGVVVWADGRVETVA